MAGQYDFVRDVDTESIIKAIQKYPCLYDTSDERHKDRVFKKDIWFAVGEALLEEFWEQMDHESREDACKQIQIRWKSVKDSYLKSIKQKDKNKNRKPYVYHKLLSFLSSVPTQSTEDSNEAISNIEFVPWDDVIEASECETPDSLLRTSLQHNKRKTDIFEKETVSTMQTNNEEIKREGSNKRKADIFENGNEIASTLQTPDIGLPLKNDAHQVSDPDEMFLLSQIPSIKRMRPADKLEFQIQFLKLVQSFSN